MQDLTLSTSLREFVRKSANRNKISDVINRIMDKKYKSSILRIDEINYLTFRRNGHLSYLPAGKDCVTNSDGEWSRKDRQTGKAAKVIRKIFAERAAKLLFKNSDFEAFTNVYKAEFNDSGYSLSLLERSDIVNVYCDWTILEGSGSLNNSCMNNKRNYLEIYSTCKALQVLVLVNNDGLLCGRALVWTIADKVYMDRIYTVSDSECDIFIEYAITNKWFYKKDYRTYSNKKTFVDSEGNEHICSLTVETDTEFDYYPYIDTFTFGDDGTITNGDCNKYTYNNTDGSRDEQEEDENDNRSYDEINGEWIDDEDCVFIEAGESRYRNRNTHINNCVFVNDRCYHKDDENIVRVDGEWYKCDDDAICFVESDEEYYLIDDCAYSDKHECWIRKVDAVRVCGDIYYKSDVEELA